MAPGRIAPKLTLGHCSMSFEDLLSELEDDFLRHGIKAVPLDRVISGGREELVAFISACHDGFRLGQPKLLQAIIDRQDRLQTLREGLRKARKSKDVAKRAAVELAMRGSEYEIAIFRKLADTVAWSICQGQHWITRRLYIGENQPYLRYSNFESTLEAAQEVSESDSLAFALISDLTSFIQVGDLLAVFPTEGDQDEGRVGQRVAIIEVKEGSKNAEIRELLEFYYEQGCPRPLWGLAKQEGKKTAKQIKRMAKQDLRGARVQQVLNEEAGIDLLTGLPVRVAEEPIDLEDYDDELNDLHEKSKAEGDALLAIDDCLAIGVYDPTRVRDPYLAFAHDIFHLAHPEEECPDPEGMDLSDLYQALRPVFPIVDLIHGLDVPLAVPIFMRRLPMNLINDVLLRRVRILLYLDYESFMRLARQQGLVADWLTSKKVHSAEAKTVFTIGKKGISFSDGEVSMTMGDGIPSRIYYDGVRPLSAVALIESYLRQAKPGGGDSA